MSDEIGLGKYAEQLLNNPAYQAAMTIIKGDLFDEFSRQTLWNDTKRRESIHKQMAAVTALENKINMMVSNGNALEKLEQRNKKLKSIR